MRPRGQLFTLDFLTAMGLFILATGLLLVNLEARDYRYQQERNQNELRMAAERASDLLVANPNWACEDASDTTHRYPNCLRSDRLQAGELTKQRLGLTDAFEVGVDFSAIGYQYPAGYNPATTPTANQDYVEIERRIVHTNQNPVTLPGSAVTPATLRVRVWRGTAP